MFCISIVRRVRLRRVACAEAQLLERARLGEREAIAVLLGRHRERIVSLAFSILRDRDSAEDAAQEIFVRAFSQLPRFRGESAFSTWLYRVALNFCLERQRVQIRRDSLLENALDEPKGHLDGSFARRVETRELVGEALGDLGKGLRVALLLREWQGLSYEEIADILQLPVGTVRSRLHEARRRFQAKWIELGGEEA
ncbi:sigma-70 family RNA polymerase sigma factor [bacterium]|nr:MAG: sigma-70 family RNA polymerase sigma factor [bacterium]